MIRRQEMELATAREGMRVLLGFGIELREEPGLADRAMELAHRLGRPATYDCYYLALAEHHDAELWTGDRRFYNAVRGHTERVNWIGCEL